VNDSNNLKLKVNYHREKKNEKSIALVFFYKVVQKINTTDCSNSSILEYKKKGKETHRQ